MWRTYFQPTTCKEALELLHQHAGRARLVAGGTDVLVELQRGVQPTSMLIDISRLRALKYIQHIDGTLRLGGLTTHNDVLASPLCTRYALPLAQACWEVGAPQIRTRATLVGNLVTASPANDTITPLVALGAELVLANIEGERVVPLGEFYKGVRRTVLKPDEIVREIRIPALAPEQRGLFIKLGLRRAQAISVINIAFVLTFTDEVVSAASITLGCLAPTIVHAKTVEAFLVGKRLDAALCRQAGQLANEDVSPIDDIRASAAYRRATLANLVAHGLQRLASGEEAASPWQEHPVLLDTGQAAPPINQEGFDGTIITTINGTPYRLPHAQQKTLLNMLREDAGLTGTKEGCAEGECGACTVWLNGQAVMSCMVPAPQAHGTAITTIEGLEDSDLHPVQRAFIEKAAVQCGYCIPGMLMASAKLLEECSQPDLEQIRTAISGNICRCTGYRKILEAVTSAGGGA